MSRETKAQRIEREHADLTELVAALRSSWEQERAEVRRLSERCSFLYEMAVTFAEEAARARLAGDRTGWGPNDGSVPTVRSDMGRLEPLGYVAPSTSRRLAR